MNAEAWYVVGVYPAGKTWCAYATRAWRGRNGCAYLSTEWRSYAPHQLAAERRANRYAARLQSRGETVANALGEPFMSGVSA